MESNDFFIACEEGNIELVEKLLDEGDDINQMNFFGEIGLHTACRHSNYEIVILLLNRGIDMNKKNGGSSTPLNVAFYNFKKHPGIMTNIIRELISRGAKLENDYKNLLKYKTDYVEEIIEIVETIKGCNIKPAVRKD